MAARRMPSAARRVWLNGGTVNPLLLLCTQENRQTDDVKKKKVH
jgi:hypothetical protein